MLGRKRHPHVGPATARLGNSLARLVSAASRWLSLQPASQGLFVAGQRLRGRSGEVAEDVSAWATDTAYQVGDTAARARRRTRRLIIDAVLVALLGYLMDWLLSEDGADRAGDNRGRGHGGVERGVTA